MTGAGALERGRDFPCKIYSNRQRGNLISGRESELQGHQRGPQRSPSLEAWGKRDEGQQDLERREKG